MTVTEQDVAWVRILYYGLFIGVFAFFLQWEGAAARVPFRGGERRAHVWRNLAMLLLVVIIADLIVGELMLHAYEFLYAPPVMLFQAMRLPVMAQIVLGLLVSDLAEYALHIASHRYAWFWRLHRVHHSDPHLDVTTAGRAHPLEVSVYVVAKIALYAILGLPLWIEGLRAVCQNTLLGVQHANVNYPPALEKLRWLLVTPAVHRVHHHPERPLRDRNFGFVFPFWDRLFGTYQAPEAAGALAMGLRGFEDERWQSLAGMLATPFRRSEKP
jgi:sterol desaturase/sphingolipid hydroxylase (fatty acid hydroxylase superfamily)